ncbi:MULTISPECIES: DUF1127 domain-containing protein [unclassified Pseudomonas]|uniref:DUF1127 domain-containing protein n=1 Tax=unclassified Pseudomonas TaxID=196821 RepID=UPI000BDAA4B5|nr:MULTISPECIES: DUF1127 domain-containing protein [unclassified Pseudomonas]PVZ08735.1 uncharacterized protein YjiS (DUF1127 family) [Pseudomonas sp. URIL14HWK12:I12]PVZ21134.1 uncharacterized protein YjiS (DUF1127 family) [Pseudomonas sp. URIL14HWK12:I10]PVZ29703.1 uncharacterized protein YjiS (DUF1127 family) [Pseudomonas sp. URIL14HWK12:I11]SNZ18894.1 Uncharacterized conserved protein YjiS, DUF1127 family [Pseudomonas sp. URIL14HWK12:I9]
MERTLSSGIQFKQRTAQPTSLMLRVAANVSLWQRRIASRHQLARLDARLLADAGITESQRCEELSKPFWR